MDLSKNIKLAIVMMQLKPNLQQIPEQMVIKLLLVQK